MPFLVFTACSTFTPDITSETPPKPAKLTLTRADFSQLRDWKLADMRPSFAAFLRSCEQFLAMDRNHILPWFAGRVKDWQNVCKSAKKSKHGAKYFFEKHFVLFRAGNNNRPKGLFTGYYEPELQGSRSPTERFKYPVYQTPPRMKKPYLTRAQIDNGALNGKGLELAWVDNPIDLFFLHIQGSGRIRLQDDTVLRVGYDGQNGHGYTSIGRYLVDQGVFVLEEVTAPKIKHWLHTHPKQAAQVMQKNASYVFFRILKGEGPIGAQGIALTPGYSLAVDKRFIAYGMPVWLETTVPDNRRFHRLMIAQDTGGAIKGPVRGDIFFGFGKEAEYLAGHMRAQGQYYLLLPKTLAQKVY